MVLYFRESQRYIHIDSIHFFLTKIFITITNIQEGVMTEMCSKKRERKTTTHFFCVAFMHGNTSYIMCTVI